MSSLHDPLPGEVHSDVHPDGTAALPELPAELSGPELKPGAQPDDVPAEDQPLFARYEYLPGPPVVRIPNFSHVSIFAILICLGYLLSGLGLAGALHLHLWGVRTSQQAANDIHYTLGGQAVWYFATLLGCLWVFPLVWQRGFFAGLQWRAHSAARFRWRILAAAAICFALAIADTLILPGPSDTPIDEIFRMPGAAWLLFAFGVTVAPIFEEIAYRGFLLPAVCTAYDWLTERITGRRAPLPDDLGHPRWSLRAMAVSSVLVSIPFALMHAEQTAYSLGPFLLLFCVSIILCWVRLSTRSLAASVAVHSGYNLLLFAIMIAGTGGFKHLENM